jgi:hypothetical protein
MVFDPTRVRLGRLPARRDARTLMLSNYLQAGQLPSAPAEYDSASKVSAFGMLANDTLGDCTVAGLLHMIEIWASQNGPQPHFTDAQAIALYSELCGYVPGNSDTDQGGVEIDILKTWRKSPILGYPLAAYVSVDPTNFEHLKIAHWLFGSLYLGVELPTSAQGETVWSDLSGDPGSWGGHCVATSGYKNASCLSDSRLTVVTWGTKQDATPEWIAKYCDEVWAPLSPAWLNAQETAPNGFNVAQLKADLALLADAA